MAAVKQRYYGMEESGIIEHLVTVFGVSSMAPDSKHEMSNKWEKQKNLSVY